MAKKLAVLMTVVCIGLAAFVVNYKLAEDGKGPEITFGNPNLEYEGFMSDADLLADVAAIDDRDGDVSASLTIEDIYSVSDEDVVVVYVAKDNSNNISKEKRMLKGSTVEEEDVFSSDIADNLVGADNVLTEESMGDVENDTDDVSGDALADDNSFLDDTEMTGSDDVTTGVPVEEKTDADKAKEEQEALADNMPAGCPRMYLTDYWIEVPVGTTIDSMSYVKDIVDESENFFELSKRVQIYDAAGNQQGVSINLPAAGTYEYNFWVVDKQSNVSNKAKLVVVAK